MRSSPDRREESSLAIGGQAVIEGVMIRSRKHMVTCVRQQNGNILTRTEGLNSLSERYRALGLPFVKGVIALFETLYLGIKSLFFSANAVLEKEEEKLTYKEMAITTVLTVALISFFITVPFLLTTFLKIRGVVFNIIEAVMRLTIFLIYLKVVSLWGDFRRVLQYHGAEHKAINAYEAGVELNFRNAKKFARLHPRCGNSFIFIVFWVSILLFSLMPDIGFFARLAYRVILIPVIGAISYEVLKLNDRHKDSKLMKILVMPGLALQRLTTREPDDEMILLAIKAVNEVNKLRQIP